jgi:glycosyltransferase involved in cell wall biosynthesis
LYLQSDVLIVPSRAEGFGIVFAEAAAYGLPSLSYETTGITTSVKNGESGILLKTNESGDSFAKCIARWYSNPTEYDVLTTLSRKHFENTVNWPTAISRFLTEIEDCINR